MADVTITASNVIPGTTAVKAYHVCGEAVTTGSPVYLKSDDSKWYKAVNTSAAAAAAVGMALNTTSAPNQPLTIATSGTVSYGAIFTKGLIYCVSDTAGAIRPSADNGSGDYVTVLGIATSTSDLALGINASGIAM